MSFPMSHTISDLQWLYTGRFYVSTAKGTISSNVDPSDPVHGMTSWPFSWLDPERRSVSSGAHFSPVSAPPISPTHYPPRESDLGFGQSPADPLRATHVDKQGEQRRHAG